MSEIYFLINETIFAIIGFLAGLFVRSHREWFSHNLTLNREKKKHKFELFRKFTNEGANIIDKILRAILYQEIKTEELALKLKTEILLKFDHLEEMKLFSSKDVLKNATLFKDALISFCGMQMDLIILVENKKMKYQELFYFLYSITEKESSTNRLEEIRKDNTVDKDVFSFLKKYSARENYFQNLTNAYSKTVKAMQEEID